MSPIVLPVCKLLFSGSIYELILIPFTTFYYPYRVLFPYIARRNLIGLLRRSSFPVHLTRDFVYNLNWVITTFLPSFFQVRLPCGTRLRDSVLHPTVLRPVPGPTNLSVRTPLSTSFHTNLSLLDTIPLTRSKEF